MPITYTNRKDRTYYLCQGTTKTGKARYYFSREPKGLVVEQMPEGYEIRESVNGVVSLVKMRPKLLLEGEIEAVKAALQAHPQGNQYRVGSKSKRITIYERVGTDLMEVGADLAAMLGIEFNGDAKRRMADLERSRAQYAPIMQFVLTDVENRHFDARQMRLLGGTERWLDIAYNQPIEKLAKQLVPTLGTDEFYELF
jgi:hypothetical protein